MRINHKYIRNRRFRSKAWKRIRSTEQPYKTHCPYLNGYTTWTFDEQVKNHFDWIAERARGMDTGHRLFFHSPKHFRQTLWKRRKAQERLAMNKINHGDYEADIPTFRRDADWEWF